MPTLSQTSIFPTVGLPNSDLAPITNTGAPDPVSDLIRRMLITIGGSTITNPDAIIDKVVGDPWTLNPSTAEKLDHFDARLHMQIDSAIAANPGAFLNARPIVPLNGPPPGTTGLPPLLMSVSAAGPVFKDIANRMTNYFTPEELIDLGVYYLSKQPFFPKDTAGWNEVKSDVIQNGLPIALAVLAVGAASNQGALSVDGKIYQVKNSDFKLGWYASVRDLGIALDPSLRGGLSAKTGKFETTAGMVYDVNAAPGLEVAGVEAVAREHVLQTLVKPYDWDIGFFTGAHYSLLNHNAAEQGRYREEFDFYAKKDHFAGEPTLEIVSSASFATDFRSQTATKFNLGMDDPRYDLAGGLSFARSTDSENRTGNSYNVGVFFGGSFESAMDRAQSRMNQGRFRVEDRLKRVTTSVARLADLSRELATLQAAGSTADPYRENMVIHDFLRQQTVVAQEKSELGESLREYLKNRNQYYVLSGHVRSRDQIPDDLGPLPAETLAQVRAALDNQPRYRSSYNVPGQNPSAAVQAQAPAEPGHATVKPDGSVDRTPASAEDAAAGAARAQPGQ